MTLKSTPIPTDEANAATDPDARIRALIRSSGYPVAESAAVLVGAGCAIFRNENGWYICMWARDELDPREAITILPADNFVRIMDAFVEMLYEKRDYRTCEELGIVLENPSDDADDGEAPRTLN